MIASAKAYLVFILETLANLFDMFHMNAVSPIEAEENAIRIHSQFHSVKIGAYEEELDCS